MRSDAENIERISNRRLKCDLELEITADGRFVTNKNNID